MSERALWRRLRGGLTGHLVRVENAVEDGTPDVEYCLQGACGWIELKHVARVPARRTTNVRIPHYTREQADWGVRRRHEGGRAWVLIQVGWWVFLFDAFDGPDIREGRTMGWYRENAQMCWERTIRFDELEEELTR